MRIDVAPRLALGVAIEPVPDHLDEPHQRLVAEHRLNEIVIDAEQIEELRQIRRIPLAAQIGFRDADIAALEKPRRKSVVVELHRSRKAGFEPPEANRAAIGQGDIEGAAPEARTDSKSQPG